MEEKQRLKRNLWTAPEALRAWADFEEGGDLRTPGPRGYEAVGSARGCGGSGEDPRLGPWLRVWQELDAYCRRPGRGKLLPKVLMVRELGKPLSGIRYDALGEPEPRLLVRLAMDPFRLMELAALDFEVHLRQSFGARPLYKPLEVEAA